MEANILPTDPPFPTTLGGWDWKVEIQLFQKHGQIKRNQEIQQNGSKYFTHRPPFPYDPRGMG